MASTYSDRLKLELQGSGENAGSWGDKTNNNLDVLDAFSAGYLSKSVAGSANVTLSTANASDTAEASNKVIELTGALTGNIVVFVPAVESNYVFFNNTTGSFTLTVAPTGHTANGAAITQGSHTMIYNKSDRCVDVLGAKVGTTATTYIGNGANLTGLPSIIPSGSLMLFQQTSAPTGWTKATTHNNKALRVVTGSASSGGSNTFSAAFNSAQTVSGTTGSTAVSITGSTAGHSITQAELPSVDLIPAEKSKTEDKGTLNRGSSSGGGASYEFINIPLGGSNSAHSHGVGTLAGGAHTHTFSDTFNLDVQYVDLIICSKD